MRVTVEIGGAISETRPMPFIETIMQLMMMLPFMLLAMFLYMMFVMIR